MDFAAELDDDFFETPKQRQTNTPANYELRVCLPLWFMEDKVTGKEIGEVLVALKHQADYHYFSKNYPKAIEAYERCLEMVPPSNNTWKREFMENLARAFLHLDDAEKALEWSLKLDKSSFSPDQKIVAMNLCAAVCHKLGKYEEELEALHCCIEPHKSCPEFWQRLGLCYAGLFKIDLPEYAASKPTHSGETEACCVFNSKLNAYISPINKTASTDNLVCCAESAIDCSNSSENNHSKDSVCEAALSKCDLCTLGIQIVSSCLIHTRMLIDSGGPNHLSADKDKQTKEKIASSLKHMEVEQSFIDEASLMLGPDFLTGLQRRESALEQPVNCVSSKKNEIQDRITED